MRNALSERSVRIMTGLIAVVFLMSTGVFAIKAATGSLRPVYHLKASFTSAGQGLQRDSDVKIHGVNIGRVTKVKLVNGKAFVTFEIKSDEKVPVDARATIRPKTLFGEKFVDVDPGKQEASGPYMRGGGTIRHTLGGFELERVLAEAYPILKAVDPAELGTVVDELAKGARGEGPAINRQIANWQKVADVNVAHNADTQEFLDDAAKLSNELANRADDLVGASKDLNQALPTLNDRGDELSQFLDQASRLSGDVADVLENNRDFLNKSATEGGKVLQLLYEERNQLPPLLTGLRQFFQTLAEAAGHTEFDQPDGSRLAAVKFVFGGGSPCGRTTVGCPGGPQGSSAPSTGASAAGPKAPAPGPVKLPPLPIPTLPKPVSGAQGLVQLVGGLLG